MMSEGLPGISVVTPVYKAEDCIEELYRRLRKTLEEIDPNFEIIMVEDGGGDASWQKIIAIASTDSRVHGIQLSRNFGQHHAIAAGLDSARGDWVVVMDCDLQDQPEEILVLYEAALQGYDVALGLRINRGDHFFRRMCSRVFYRAFNFLTGMKFDRHVSGFCVLSRKAVDALCSIRESSRFLMAFVEWIGFPSIRVPVNHASRTRGKSSYSLGKLLLHALDAAVGFSSKPLFLAVFIGGIMSALSFFAGIWIIAQHFLGGLETPGWASVMVSIWFVAGLIVLNLGVVGIYLGKVYEQTKGRPLYIVRRTTDEEVAG
jgi:dolichol-phosphate mannosyltransferase